MSRWLRWQFVVLRLLLCVVTVMGAYFAIGLAVRSVAMRSGEQMLAARVDVENARVSLSDGRVLLGRMHVSDPRDPAKCLFTADGCELEMAAAALLAKQVIVSNARMRNVRFGESRAESALESHGGPIAARWIDDHAVEAATDRLTKIGDQFDKKCFDRFESVRRTTESCSRWPGEFEAINERAAKLEADADDLEKTVAAAIENPLRNSRSLDEVSAKVSKLRTDFEGVSSDFSKLPLRLEEERRWIVAARRQDEEFVRGKLHFEPIDAKLLNAYLLRDQAARQLEGLITWLRLVRTMAPADTAQPSAGHRGEDVLFAGIRPRPNFLIRALELQGETRFDGRPIEFRGLVSNLSSAPSIHDAPIRLRLSAKDAGPIELRATIDRTNGRVRDELFVECREADIGGRSLGQAELLQLNVAPSTGSLIVSLSVEGDKLSGDIQLVQQQVRMTPVIAVQGDTLSIGESLDRSLGKLGSLATRISLDGTVDQPEYTLWSNFGSAVAEALEHGLQRHAEAYANVILDDAQRRVDERLAELDRQVAEHRAKFESKTAIMAQRIDALARSQTPRERISVEQAGRRLPASSILR